VRGCVSVSVTNRARVDGGRPLELLLTFRRVAFHADHCIVRKFSLESSSKCVVQRDNRTVRCVSCPSRGLLDIQSDVMRVLCSMSAIHPAVSYYCVIQKMLEASLTKAIDYSLENYCISVVNSQQYALWRDHETFFDVM
jgi:hypothetical protein